MSTSVIPCSLEQSPILANLLELYIYDFSELVEIELGPDGRFGYQELPLYWRETGRFPFLLRVRDEWAGFALVKTISNAGGAPDLLDMAEFFVLRKHRRQRTGMTAAHQLWRLIPGRWQIRVLESNRSAFQFWSQAIAAFLGAPIDPISIGTDEKPWHVFLFESIGGA